MSDNWVVQNLENALEVWNGKLSEIWQLITQSPQDFKDGAIWNVVADIHGALQAIGYALLVLFFVVGVVKTCGSFVEVKKPEHALKLFVRFALAKALITYGMELIRNRSCYRRYGPHKRSTACAPLFGTFHTPGLWWIPLLFSASLPLSSSESASFLRCCPASSLPLWVVRLHHPVAFFHEPPGPRSLPPAVLPGIVLLLPVLPA